MDELIERLAMWLHFVMPPINRGERMPWIDLPEETRTEYRELAAGPLREIAETHVLVEREAARQLVSFFSSHAAEYGGELGMTVHDLDYDQEWRWDLPKQIRTGEITCLTVDHLRTHVGDDGYPLETP